MDWFAFGAHRSDNGVKTGIALDQETLVDLADAAAVVGRSTERLGQLDRSLYERWDEVGAELIDLGEFVASRARDVRHLPNVIDSITAPIVPTRIFAAASNFIDHADEMGTVLAAKETSKPFMFVKVDSTVIGTGDSVVLPPESNQVDWEVELLAVIGKMARNITVDQALEHVAGYSVINDVSARDLNMRSDYPFKFDWFQGKNFDTFSPIGPWVTPAAFIPDPQDIHLQLDVNNETMQDAKTSEMIFTVAEQIAYLSTILTLRPGDSIATGTPDGVGMGRGIYLKNGDKMVATIEKIGRIANPVVSS